MKEITLNIDNMKVTVPAGSTILEAARSAGIYIPTLCHDDKLKPYGSCRLCIVEIEGVRGLPTSCTIPVAEGMVVRTDTEEVTSVRRTICEMLIADHPADCLSCSSNQKCELQKIAAFLGINKQRITKKKPEEVETVIDDSNPFFVRDMAKCIMCGRCVRICNEVRKVNAIGIVGRGYDSKISTFNDMPLIDSICESCGECVDHCPTGALSPENEIFPATQELKTTCPYCGCACGIDVGIRSNKIVTVRGDNAHPISKGSLCVKGRFGLDFVHAEDRLTTPLIKKDGKFYEASWDEALSLVAEKLASVKNTHGADSIVGFASGKCVNEDNYIFQKFIRGAVGTNNVDHCARLCHASTVAGLARAFGSGAMTNSIDEIKFAKSIFVTGSNTTEAHPIIAQRIKDAVVDLGAELIVADPRKIDLVRFASVHVRQKSGTDVALFNAMINYIISENLHDREFIESRTEDFELLAECVKECTPEWAENITSIPACDIRKIAEKYATAETASIIFSMGITQHTTGTDNVLALANLAMLTGNVGKESTGVNPLRGQNNVQGACDLGALPNVYPGYQKVDDPAVRDKFQKLWNRELSDKAGLTVTEAINASAEGSVKAIYIMGENPMISDPNLNHAEKALKNLDFLCVQDIFLTETAQLADVVLPGVCFAEKDGTFTSTERRVQRVRKLVNPPGTARQDWNIICEISTKMGFPMKYGDASEIMDEIAVATPIYGGIDFKRIDKVGLQWPCPDKKHPGTKFLHKDKFNRGKGKFYATAFREAAELPDREYPLRLTTGRYLQHFHTGTMTRKVDGLNKLAPPVPVEISPEDAEMYGIFTGDKVEVTTRRGFIIADAVITEKSPKGTIFMAFHYREAPVNRLTNDVLDSVAKIPEYKVCAVKIKKA